MYELKNKYPDYIISRAQIVDEKIAVISIYDPINDIQMYMAIMGADGKTIIVTYSFNNEDFFEAELYFAIVLSEMAECV